MQINAENATALLKDLSESVLLEGLIAFDSVKRRMRRRQRF